MFPMLIVGSAKHQSSSIAQNDSIANRTRSKTTAEIFDENEETDSDAQQTNLIITSSLVGETMLLLKAI